MGLFHKRHPNDEGFLIGLIRRGGWWHELGRDDSGEHVRLVDE